MDEKKWWLAEGVIVLGYWSEAKMRETSPSLWQPVYVGKGGKFYKEYRTEYGYYCGGLTEPCRYKLIGAPFDCIPEWAKAIDFEMTKFRYKSESKISAYIDYKNCPKEWKMKTLLITDELRGLLND